MTQIAKKQQKYIVFWAIYTDEYHSIKRYVLKAPAGTKVKSDLFDWIEELEKVKSVDNMGLINCGVVED